METNRLKELEKTDITKWYLNVDEGAQWWTYEPESQKTQSLAEKYFLGLDQEVIDSEEPNIDKGIKKLFYRIKELQLEDGHWGCEYGGPMFLLPNLIACNYAIHLTHHPHSIKAEDGALNNWQRIEIIRYLVHCFKDLNAKEGGWGLHIEQKPTMYGTVTNYVALRLLGMASEHKMLIKARNWIKNRGGAYSIPSWGKSLLAILGLYDYEGCNSLPPELWLLPDISPFNPHNMWIHTRMVFLPMSYLFGVRFKCPFTPLILDIRKELYQEDYSTIQWNLYRNSIASEDNYYPSTNISMLLNKVLNLYENIAFYLPLRRMAVKKAYEFIKMEDENTDYRDLASVNNPLIWVCVYHAEGLNSISFKKHSQCIKEFLWMSNRGLMMCGTNGVQLWDTVFTTQAMMESGLAFEKSNQDCIKKAYQFIDLSQVRENTINYGKDYRHRNKGAWTFSTKKQGYTLSDCTAEGVKTILLIQNSFSFPILVSDRRLFDAVDTLLSMQNSSGGIASYELIRGYFWYEWFNAAQVFGNIMIEYTYPETSTAFLLALDSFSKYYPNYRSQEIASARAKVIDYIYSTQRPDGSWYGSWGICFTYGTYFSIESLSSVGKTYKNCSYVKRACEFLISKQNHDGGWGETYKSCETHIYTPSDESQVVNTSWALLSLMAAKYPKKSLVLSGIK